MAPESRRLNGVGRSRTGASSVNDRLKALSDRSGESSAGGSRFHVHGWSVDCETSLSSCSPGT